MCQQPREETSGPTNPRKLLLCLIEQLLFGSSRNSFSIGLSALKESFPQNSGGENRRVSVAT